MIYLYIKQHNITGLKYFGRTIKNPFIYKGSGGYWRRHIKKHGEEHVLTLEVYGFDTQEDCTEFALKFSELNDIVESKDWANQIAEDGRRVGILHSDLTRKKIGDKHRGKPKPASKKTLDAINQRRANGELHPSTKRWKITLPSGEVKIIDNLVQFCKEHKLSAGNLSNYGRTKGYTAEKLGFVKHLELADIC